MAKHKVAKTSELVAGERKCLTVGGRPIVVFNVGGTYRALLNRCPHQGAPLGQGIVTGAVTSEGAGRYNLSHTGEILRCPWHGWEFRIETGESWFDPQHVTVRTFPTSVGSEEEGQEAPRQVETFPVTVEDQYVYVEV